MKTYRYVAILTLNYFSQGLLVAVLSLILLDKGLRFSDIAVAMGVYALTVAVLEVPTGLLADRIGRKRVFLFALIVQAVSFVVFLFGYGTFAVIIGIFFFGVGRALASGSFEALFIDRYTDAYGDIAMPKAIRALSVSEAAGLAAGALLGGFLPIFALTWMPSLTSAYDIDLLFRLLLSVLLLFLVWVWIPADHSKDAACQLSVKVQLSESYRVVHKSKNIKLLLISVVATGFALCVLESYWQPQLLTLLDNNVINTAPLGILSVLYLLSLMLGNMFVSQIVTKHVIYTKNVYLFCRFAMGVSLLLLLVSTSIVGFFVFYCAFYFFFGGANIAEGTMINLDTPNRYRASILSTQSLVMQIGMLLAAVLSKVYIDRTSVKFLWFIAAIVIIVLVLPAFKIKRLPFVSQ